MRNICHIFFEYDQGQKEKDVFIYFSLDGHWVIPSMGKNVDAECLIFYVVLHYLRYLTTDVCVSNWEFFLVYLCGMYDDDPLPVFRGN